MALAALRTARGSGAKSSAGPNHEHHRRVGDHDGGHDHGARSHYDADHGHPLTTSLGAGATTPTGGGGQVGLLLISPFVKPASIDLVDYFNHFSLLASIENLFGLKPLGYADAPGLPVFGLGVFNNYAG